MTVFLVCIILLVTHFYNFDVVVVAVAVCYPNKFKTNICHLMENLFLLTITVRVYPLLSRTSHLMILHYVHGMQWCMHYVHGMHALLYVHGMHYAGNLAQWGNVPESARNRLRTTITENNWDVNIISWADDVRTLLAELMTCEHYQLSWWCVNIISWADDVWTLSAEPMTCKHQ